MKLLVLSPHRDDAAFSLSLATGRWLANKHKVTILNVFTRSLEAPYSDAESVHENDRLQWVSAMRKREDAEFLKRMPGLMMVDLNLKDAAIRLRLDAAAARTMTVDANDPAIPKIQKAVRNALAEGFEGLVVPLGLGGHLDHRVVRDAVLEFTAGIPSAFYEDLPDAAEGGLSWDVPGSEPVLCGGGQENPKEYKLKLVRLYASQVDDDEARKIAEFSGRYGGAERLWANPRWVELAAERRLSTPQGDDGGPAASGVTRAVFYRIKGCQ